MYTVTIFERLNTPRPSVPYSEWGSYFNVSHKGDILHPQEISKSNPNIAPTILPQPIEIFLSAAIGIPIDMMDDCWAWAIFYDYVWEMPLTPLTSEDYQRVFKHHVWKYGFSCIPSFTLTYINLMYVNSNQHYLPSG